MSGVDDALIERLLAAYVTGANAFLMHAALDGKTEVLRGDARRAGLTAVLALVRADGVAPSMVHARPLTPEQRAEMKAMLRGDTPAFVEYENPEARWLEDCANACPACGGSGHKDDAADLMRQVSFLIDRADALVDAVCDDPEAAMRQVGHFVPALSRVRAALAPHVTALTPTEGAPK